MWILFAGIIFGVIIAIIRVAQNAPTNPSVPVNSTLNSIPISEAQLMASQYLKIAKDSERLVNTTVNPDVFFSRYDLMIEQFRKLAGLEHLISFSGTLPSAHLNTLIATRDQEAETFIRRSFKKMRDEVGLLKTENGKSAKIERYFSKMNSYCRYLSQGNQDLLYTLKSSCKESGSFKEAITSLNANTPSKNSIPSPQASDGFYDFSFLDKNELATISTVLRSANSKYTPEMTGLGLVIESASVVYKPRYVIQEIIIQKYKHSENPFDVLATALAYLSKGAQFRSSAIECFEKYFRSADASQRRLAAKYCPAASEPLVLLNLAELYEKENRLDEALETALKADCLNHSVSPGFPLRIGSIYLKMNPIKCVEYFSQILNDIKYSEYYDSFLKEYDNALEKQQRGYKYKPRRKKEPDTTELERRKLLEGLAREFLPGGKYYSIAL